MKRAHKALLRGLLGLALLAAVLALADPSRVLAQLRQSHIGWLLAGLAAGIASNLVSALRWRALARWLGAEVSVRDATRWYFQAIGLNALLPGAVVGGDVYRADAGRIELDVFPTRHRQRLDDGARRLGQALVLGVGQQHIGATAPIGDEHRPVVGRALGAGRVLVEFARGEGLHDQLLEKMNVAMLLHRASWR